MEIQANGAAEHETAAPPKAKRTRKPKTKTIEAKAIDNPSGIHPTEFNCVVRPEEIETVTKGGIIIPLNEAEKMQNAATIGVIIAVSPLAFTYERWPEGASPPKVGDRVVYSKYAGMKQKGKDKVEYLIVKDKDIAAILDF